MIHHMTSYCAHHPSLTHTSCGCLHLKFCVVAYLGLLLVLWLVVAASGQRPPRPGGGRSCTDSGRVQCPTSPPFMTVSIRTDENFRYVETNTCPVYSSMWQNPNQACEIQTTYILPLNPQPAATPIPVGQIDSVYENITYLQEDPAPILGALGVLVSGVNIFGVGSPCGGSSSCPEDGGPTLYVDAVESEGHTVDGCGGHASPSNEYHIHSGLGINTTEGREMCRLPVDRPRQHSQLLGWMFDGYGLYGRYSLNGEVPDDLDDCGGHTHMIDGVEIYHYHLPDAFPWIIGCFKGCPEISNNPRQLGFAAGEEYGCPETFVMDTTTMDTTTVAMATTVHGYGVVTFLCPLLMIILTFIL